MSILQPFRPLMPSSERVSLVAAVPYDVVSKEEAQALTVNNRWSFLHISRPEIDLPEGESPYSKKAYEQASANFKHLTTECPLHRDSEPSLYLYQLRMGSHEQTGIVGSFSIDEYDNDLIKKHERTRSDKEDDRTHHILALKSQTGPVFLAFRDVPEVEKQMVEAKKSVQPLYRFTASDGIEHQIWKLPNHQLSQIFATQVRELYIADGHHRAAAASRARKQMKQQNLNHEGNEDYNFFLAVAFPASQLKILSYHRAVKELNGHTPTQLKEKLGHLFEVQLGDAQLPPRGEIGMYLEQTWYRLRPKQKPANSLLDVTLLQESILAPILGISDPRSDRRIDFIGGIRGTEELEKLVHSGSAAVAFSMHPTQLEEVMEVADQGGIMPPKSTWFEPKLRDGIFCHSVG